MGVARVSLTDGDVRILRSSGDGFQARAGMPLVLGDRFVTGPKSRAEVQFDGGNFARLSADTEVRIGELGNRRFEIEVVNGLVKAVRAQGRAEMIIDPGEPWTSLPCVLGGPDDPAYLLEARVVLPDGRRLLRLRRRAHDGRRRPTGRHPRPPDGVDVVLAVRHVDRALHLYDLDVIEGGVRRRRRIEVNAPGPAGGLALAVADWAATREGRTVGLPDSGAFRALCNVLLAEDCHSSDIAFGDGARRLRGGRRWRRQGQWVVG